MSELQPKDICESVPVDDDAAFRAFIDRGANGLAMIAEPHGEVLEPVLKSDAGDFAKWLRTQHPEIEVEVPETERLLLRSGDLWLPLVFLATNVGLPVYLNLVSSYLYDWMKGALRGERPRVHLSAEYLDEKNGSVKRFNFEGDAEALVGAIQAFDLNEFLDD